MSRGKKANPVLEQWTTLAAAGAVTERIQKVVLDMIGRFPQDLDALEARKALEPTRGDGHAISPDDIRLFDTRID